MTCRGTVQAQAKRTTIDACSGDANLSVVCIVMSAICSSTAADVIGRMTMYRSDTSPRAMHETDDNVTNEGSTTAGGIASE